MVYGWYTFTYVIYKPTYNWGGHHLVGFEHLKHTSVVKAQHHLRPRVARCWSLVAGLRLHTAASQRVSARAVGSLFSAQTLSLVVYRLWCNEHDSVIPIFKAHKKCNQMVEGDYQKIVTFRSI